MSRVGKQPIELPKGVKAEIAGQLLKIEGPKGKVSHKVTSEITAKIVDGKIVLSRTSESKRAAAFHGTERANIKNIVVGVSEGFARELELIGVGYRAEVKGNILTLGLGYSHSIDFELPKGVTGSVLKDGRDVAVRLEGIDKSILGQTSARLRSLRLPEPYKGKGVKYRGEVIARKAGKSGKK